MVPLPGSLTRFYVLFEGSHTFSDSSLSESLAAPHLGGGAFLLGVIPPVIHTLRPSGSFAESYARYLRARTLFAFCSLLSTLSAAPPVDGAAFPPPMLVLLSVAFPLLILSRRTLGRSSPGLSLPAALKLRCSHTSLAHNIRSLPPNAPAIAPCIPPLFHSALTFFREVLSF